MNDPYFGCLFCLFDYYRILNIIYKKSIFIYTKSRFIIIKVSIIKLYIIITERKSTLKKFVTPERKIFPSHKLFSPSYATADSPLCERRRGLGVSVCLTRPSPWRPLTVGRISCRAGYGRGGRRPRAICRWRICFGRR